MIISTFLPMRNQFVYSCSKKKIYIYITRASGFDELLEIIFCLLLVVELFFLQKVLQILEEVVVSC